MIWAHAEDSSARLTVNLPVLLGSPAECGIGASFVALREDAPAFEGTGT
ncbi:hypothetical protein CHISP_2511 [Chitinispirillum alkaliphilum]|nr:hypothetical protein CHISP_2511 [Chitinispirillum alkaliphilum]